MSNALQIAISRQIHVEKSLGESFSLLTCDLIRQLHEMVLTSSFSFIVV